MADEEEQNGSPPSAISNLLRPSFPGFRNLWRRFGGRKPPRHDPTQARVWYQPCFRVVSWIGDADSHTTDPCIPPHCTNSNGPGLHQEVREDGFNWCGVHFSSLVEAMENQAFRRWYEEGYFEGEHGERGKNVMARGKLVLRPALYGAGQEPPLPPYNFFLHEHIHEMTPNEIRAYQTKGEVPKRLRRRGRARR